MAEMKTIPTDKDVVAFIHETEDPEKREDCLQLLKIMERISGDSPKMWGPSIIGFGHYHYKYESGREGDFFQTGFSPRKQNLTLYIMAGFDNYPELMSRLGKYRTGKSCLYVKKLSDIDLQVLEELIAASIQYIKERYGEKK